MCESLKKLTGYPKHQLRVWGAKASEASGGERSELVDGGNAGPCNCSMLFVLLACLSMQLAGFAFAFFFWLM